MRIGGGWEEEENGTKLYDMEKGLLNKTWKII